MKDDAWEKYERVCSSGYKKDPRWKQVALLRKQGKTLEANGLVFKIRDDWDL